MSEVIEAPAPQTTQKPRKAPQIEIVAGKLLDALQAVAGIVERRTSLPVLSNVLMQFGNGMVRLTTSDIDRQMEGSAELVKGDYTGAITVGAAKLVAILKSLPVEAVVKLKLGADKIEVKGHQSTFSIKTLPAADFPTVAQAEYDASITMKQRTLLGLLQQTSYCMGVSDVRFYLNGMLLETGGGTVCAVATDGHRMALAKSPVDGEVDERSVIVPRKSILELERLLQESDADIQIRLASNQASFTFGTQRFITKLLDGKYPDYKRVIPNGGPISLTFERTMLVDALRSAELVCSEKFKGVQLDIKPGQMLVSARNEQEDAAIDIGIDLYQGDALVIGFNVVYLIDALTNIDTDTVTLTFGRPSDSVLILDPKHRDFRGVVMPMRI